MSATLAVSLNMLNALWNVLTAAVGFVADLLTAALGLIGLWAVVVHRNKVSAVIQLFVNTYLNQRIQRAKETLGRLEALNFDTKDHRAEIHALLGQLSGQLKSIANENQDVATTYADLKALVENRSRVTEASKRRIVFEVHGAVDGAYFGRAKSVMKAQHEQ